MPSPGDTLHPHLRSAETRAEIASQWDDGKAMRLSGVLDPGLAAELAEVLGPMPAQARLYERHSDLSWSCDLGVPEAPDPQHPRCLFRLIRFLQTDLPALVSAITGRALTQAEPGTVHLWSLRKGSYVDAGGPLAPPGGIDVWLGLTGTTWPEAWGGHPVWTSGRERNLSLPPSFDTLDLLDGGTFRIPVLTRHVRTLTVRTFLTAEAP